MSWDLMAFKVPPEFKSVNELPKTWEPEPFSVRSKVEATLREMLPTIEFKIPVPTVGLWGFYRGDGFALEISLGKTETIDHLWIAVRGNTATALSVVSEIVDAFGLRGVDLQRGEFFDLTEAGKSYADWRGAVARFKTEKLEGG